MMILLHDITDSFLFGRGCFDMCVLSAVLCCSIWRVGQPMMDWLPSQGVL